jgi:hypothetical protein
MAVEDHPAINLHLFQVQAEAGALEVVQGIAVRELTPEELFVDPQNDYGHPTTSTDDENLILGVSEALATTITPAGRIIHASLPLEEGRADHRYRLREEIGLDELDIPVQNPVGHVALLGIAERDGLKLTRLFPDPYGHTSELHAAVMTRSDEERRDQAKLILLAAAGELYVDVRGDKGPRRYSLEYLVDGSFLHFHDLSGGDERQEGGGGGGPSPDDRQPRPPITPTDSAAAAAELPPEQLEQTLQAIGNIH